MDDARIHLRNGYWNISGNFTADEKKLLLVDFADKERQKFERLKVKFSAEQTENIKYERTRLWSLFVAPQPTPDEILGLAAQMYAGLSEQEVSDVEKVALDRSHLTGPRQPV